MKNKFAYIVLMASALAMGGCKAPSLTPTEKFDLPEAFIEDTDTVTMASVSWKEFFPGGIYRFSSVEQSFFPQDNRKCFHSPCADESRKGNPVSGNLIGY